MPRALIAAALAFLLVAAAPSPPLDPIIFFTGPSRGSGSLKILMKSAVPLQVASIGRPDGRGGIILHQAIREGRKPVRLRRWILRRTSPTTFAGSLTDSRGPVTGRVRGKVLEIRYTMKNGLAVHQSLTLRRGRRSLDNEMIVSKFGIRVARVREVITKTD